MGGRGSGGGRGSKTSSSSAPISKGEKIYREKVLKNSYIGMNEFKEVKEYLKNNASKEEILKVANHYGELYKNKFDISGDTAAMYKTYENSLNTLAVQKGSFKKAEKIKYINEKGGSNIDVSDSYSSKEIDKMFKQVVKGKKMKKIGYEWVVDYNR